jgi:hypothetical protein
VSSPKSSSSTARPSASRRRTSSACRGDPATEILRKLAERLASVLALGWHGRFAAGRAPVFKRLLEEVTCPMLVVREAPAPRARLKVGEEIEEPDLS